MSEARKFWLWAFAFLALLFLGQDMCLWSAPRILRYPSFFLLFASVMTVFLFLAAIPAALYFSVRAFILRKDRPSRLAYLSQSAACLTFAALWIAIMLWSHPRRSDAFARASEHGDTIVWALSKYRDDTGEYPGSLGKLVPVHLDQIPYTGLVGYPEFTYRKGYNDLRQVENSFELRISCPSGGINFDRFIYWPSERYPDRIQGNGIEKIGSWVYVHE